MKNSILSLPLIVASLLILLNGVTLFGQSNGDDFRKKAPVPTPAPLIQIGKATTTKLKNGLTVIVVENHKLPTLSVELFCDYVPVMENEAKGYVEMMGDLWLKGTINKTKVAIDAEIDFLGSNISSSATGINGSCLSKHTDKFLAIFSDIAQNPVFPQEELDKAIKRQLSNLQQGQTDGNFLAQQLSAATCYGKTHPYGEITTEKSLSKVNTERIAKHYQSYCKPNNSFLVLVGDITPGKAQKLANKYFGGWKPGEINPAAYGVPNGPEANQVHFVHKPGAVQSVISITYPVDLKPGSQDDVRSRVMNTILGAYFNSRVNSNLREGHGWTYGAGTRLNADELVGNFTATASVRNSVTDSAVVEFLKEMDRLRTEKVNDKELQLVKNVMAGQFSQNLESSQTIARFALNKARFQLPDDYYETYLTKIQNVSADEITLMARRYLKPDKCHIVVAGNKDQVADKLKVFASDGKLGFYDAYANPINPNKISLPADITAKKVIEDYLNAVHLENLGTIATLHCTGKIQTGGPVLELSTQQKGNSKYRSDIKMGGQSLSTKKYNGTKAIENGAGGASRELTDKLLEDIKEQARFIKEVDYLSGGYQLTLKGIENIGDANAYEIIVTRPDGKMTTAYYDMKTSLKIQEIETEDEQIITTSMSDYRAVSGVLFPFKSVLSGATPTPLTLIWEEIKANVELPDSLFDN
jgi:predicted Zn-dependent peptidase